MVLPSQSPAMGFTRTETTAPVSSIKLRSNTEPTSLSRAWSTAFKKTGRPQRSLTGAPTRSRWQSKYLKTDELIGEPTAEEKLRLAVDHMDRLIDLKCEKVALLEMRSHMAWYIKGLEGATHVKRMITTVKTREEMMDIIIIKHL